MSLHASAYSQPGYSAPPYSESGYHHPPGGQIYYSSPAACHPPDTASSTHSSQQRYWYGQHPSCAPLPPSPESDRFNRKRRRCTYMYYVLRQLAIVVPLVVVFLNINIYVSRRGKYLNDDTSPSDPIFYAMWLSVPLSVLMMLWSFTTVIFRKRAEHQRGGIPKHVHFGMELCFSLGATICWILLVIQIESKKSNAFYAYPYMRYEAALAFLLGLIMLSEYGLLFRAWFEFSNDRTRLEDQAAMVQV
ncbi:hypothetical protein CGCF415_v013256 [Colletotrichum fructicola]|uniref:Uncharacterized protein n=1 Tax=Colletotrichum chrysophilum TaxID=1836956 RepID=A0AAD9A3D0_9PEZI|nr:uncharacterized protein COL26b_013672 [Colletotrichum chrysophilum]KAF4891734.1 hypothetical protein CGCF415_v013256 [Colletotrichum fructicola]KAI8272393.1 hypothetical protein K4K60_012863 [Colletotrichum sp. SAR11_57]KAF4927283.1 hypothetical protein CGCF245_v013264 [Colletotrichum fructicola]KAF5493420.1 hypothetical protein CGCF413_v009491 [Colletotrichum fructicola]KAJ0337667.1 hypothetical protein KNSL1_012761 [Colletotrichum chrysophilum]